MRFDFAGATLLGAMLCATAASAQVVAEVGGQVGVACQRGRESCAGAFVGPTIGMQWNDRLEVRIRYFRFTIADRTIAADNQLFHETSVNRRMILGEIVYNFGSHQRFQPLLGLSVGQRRDMADVSCSPQSCAEGQVPGASRFYDGSPVDHVSVGVVAGFSYRPADRLRIQGLVGLHDFPRDDGQTVEGLLLIAVGLWKSR